MVLVITFWFKGEYCFTVMSYDGFVYYLIFRITNEEKTMYLVRSQVTDKLCHVTLMCIYIVVHFAKSENFFFKYSWYKPNFYMSLINSSVLWGVTSGVYGSLPCLSFVLSFLKLLCSYLLNSNLRICILCGRHWVYISET